MSDFITTAKTAYNNPASLGHVWVLYGGESQEKEVSIKSGEAVYQALVEAGVNAKAIKIDSWGELIHQLTSQPPQSIDCVFSLLHGSYGEDGTIHGLLELLKIPYVGSGVLASQIAMDKVLCKKLWQDLPLSIPPSAIAIGQLSDSHDTHDISGHTNSGYTDYTIVGDIPSLPIVVKPVSEGSSCGISLVTQENQLAKAIAFALEYDSQVLLEKYIDGDEVTVAIIGEEPLPPIEIIPKQQFYDYEAKYISDETVFHCPPEKFNDSQNAVFQQQALIAFQSIGSEDWGRVDFMVDKQSTPWLLEVNLIPGMTSHSLVPQAAKQIGLSFSELVCGLIAEKYRKIKKAL